LEKSRSFYIAHFAYLAAELVRRLEQKTPPFFIQAGSLHSSSAGSGENLPINASAQRKRVFQWCV
jgi:hypothetical protein